MKKIKNKRDQNYFFFPFYFQLKILSILWAIGPKVGSVQISEIQNCARNMDQTLLQPNGPIYKLPTAPSFSLGPILTQLNFLLLLRQMKVWLFTCSEH